MLTNVLTELARIFLPRQDFHATKAKSTISLSDLIISNSESVYRRRLSLQDLRKSICQSLVQQPQLASTHSGPLFIDEFHTFGILTDISASKYQLYTF